MNITLYSRSESSFKRTTTSNFLWPLPLNTLIESRRFEKLKLSRFLVMCLLLSLFTVVKLSASNRFSIANGNWNATTTWSATSGGTAGASVPVDGDIVTIEGGRTVTVTANAACTSIVFSVNNANNTLSINSGITLTASGAITIPRAGGSGTTYINTLAVGSGNLNAGSIAFTNGGGSVRHQVTISTGTIIVTGDVTGTAGNTSGSVIFTGAGLFRLGGSLFASTDGTLTTSTGTVEYNGSTQNVGDFAYYNLIISGGGTKTLLAATAVSHNLTLTSGVLTTATGKILSITNTATTAISGGSTSSFINGPVSWTLPASLGSGSTYIFPVGNNYYLPFALVNPTTGTGTVTAQVQALNANSSGTFDVTISSVSTTEYWQLTTSGNFTNSSVSLNRQTAITPLNEIGGSTALAGTYTSLNGTAGTYAVTGSDAIGSNRYFMFATKGSIITTTTSNLMGFTYIYDFGPSGEQSFSVSGTLLTADITLTAPADFEISTTPGTSYQSSITLTRSGTTVSSTPIYVRLKAGLAVGSYGYITAENISVTSGSNSKTVTCKGFVTSSNPYIVAGGGITCDNDSIYLTSTGPNVVNQYWTGPNSFYSNLQNPTIPSITTANTGTYTVTGSILSNVNLLVNPGFESGNTGFTTDYTYTTTDLTPEGNYAIIQIPHDLHSAFSSNPPHTGIKQMVVNGKATTANVWTETITVIPNTIYQFSYWEQSVVTTSPSQLQLYANGTAVGSPYTAPSVLNQWNQYIYNWNSGANTSVILSLQNKNYVANGNDFALDDLDFEPLIQVTSSVSLTFNSQVAGVSVAASPTTVGLGSSVTYTATPTNGGLSPTYQWSVNGVNAGTSSPTFNYVPTSSSDVVKCVMTSNKSCVTGNPATSNLVSVTVTGSRNYWMGTASSSQWLVPGNWTKGFVPAPGDDVEFATTSNNGGNAALNDLLVDANHIVGNLINQTTNRKVIVQPTKFLVVNQNITSNNPDRIYIQSSSSAANGSLIFHNPQNLPAYGTVEMYSKAFYNSAGPVNGKYKWQYFGIPVDTITAYPTFAGSYLRRWDETRKDSTKHWTSLSNSSLLKPFFGYEITQVTPTTIIFQGKLINRDFNSGQLAKTDTAAFPGQHIFANPFTAAINITQLVFGSNMDATVYLYNTGSYGDWTGIGGRSSNGNYAGQYLSIPKNTAGNLMPLQVPSMQAMLVKVNNSTSTATLSIPYNAVVMKNTDLQRVSASKEFIESGYMIGMMIEVNGANFTDKMWLFSNPTCTRNFDNGWDGQKLTGSVLSPQIFSVEADGNYQVNAVDDINNTQIGFQAGEDIEYKLTFTNQNLEQKYAGVYLVDSLENKIIDVTKSGTTYTFEAVTTPTTVNRFKIVTRFYDTRTLDESAQLKVFNDKNTVYVENASSQSGDLYLYDVMGRLITKKPFTQNSITTLDINSITGTYIVYAVTSTERVGKQLVIVKPK